MTPAKSDVSAAWDKFLLWELSARDMIDFKKIYVDMAGGDLNAGLMLSELVYWYLPPKQGESPNKLKVEHDGFFWIACRRYEWWERARLTPDKADAAIRALVKAGLVIKKVYKFYGNPTVHLRIATDLFMKSWGELVRNPPLNPFLPDSEIGKNGKTKSGKSGKPNQEISESDLGDSANSLTEISPESTAWITAWGGNVETLPAYIVAMIFAWAREWAGKPAGNVYGNKHIRKEAEAMLKRGLTPANVETFCKHLHSLNKWRTSRPAFNVIANDIDSWLQVRGELPTPAPAAEPDDESENVNLEEIEGKIRSQT